MNWFKYRLPGQSEAICGASENILNYLSEGFVIAPFKDPGNGFLTIPFDFIPDTDDLHPELSHVPQTTDTEDYISEVTAIINDLDGERGKTVAARVIRLDKATDLNRTFDSLCKAYPEAFVFCFSTPMSGTWIGATPELLLKKVDSYISTMALAGTRAATTDDPEWDEKNKEEQEIVADFIRDSLTDASCQTITGKTFTKKAGAVEHICTPIAAFMEADSDERIASLLTRLSPTPAVCGNDREHSIDIIGCLEKFDREYYGGFCGPYNVNGKTEFYVMLRCAKCTPSATAVFVGGGITHLSMPEEELKETELKSYTLIQQLKTK